MTTIFEFSSCFLPMDWEKRTVREWPLAIIAIGTFNSKFMLLNSAHWECVQSYPYKQYWNKRKIYLNGRLKKKHRKKTSKFSKASTLNWIDIKNRSSPIAYVLAPQFNIYSCYFLTKKKNRSVQRFVWQSHFQFATNSELFSTLNFVQVKLYHFLAAIYMLIKFYWYWQWISIYYISSSWAFSGTYWSINLHAPHSHMVCESLIQLSYEFPVHVRYSSE